MLAAGGLTLYARKGRPIFGTVPGNGERRSNRGLATGQRDDVLSWRFAAAPRQKSPAGESALLL